MPKYQSISDLRQAVVLEGNRVLMFPGDVIESSKELRYAFLEEVTIDTPVTLTKSRRITPMADLQAKLEELQNEKDSSVVAGKEELEAVAQSVENMRDDIKQIAEEETGKVSTQLTELAAKYENVEEMFESFVTYKRTMNRRMEMLKSALMTIQEDVYGVAFDGEGRAVSTDATKSE